MSNSNDPFADPSAPADPTEDGAQAAVKGGMSVAARIIICLVALAAGGGFLWMLMAEDAPPALPAAGMTVKPAAGTGVTVGGDDFGQPKDLKQFTDFQSRQVKAIVKEREDQNTKLDLILQKITGIENRVVTLEAGAAAVARISPEEERRQKAIASLPQAIRTVVPEATEYVISVAKTRGIFDPAETVDLLTTWLTAKVPNEVAPEANARSLYEIAKLKREALADVHVAQIPNLAPQVAAKRLAPTNTPQIARLIWEQRGNLPAMTPGQIMTMASQIGLVAQGVPLAQAQARVDGTQGGAVGPSGSAMPEAPTERRSFLVPWGTVAPDDLGELVFLTHAHLIPRQRDDALIAGVGVGGSGRVADQLQRSQGILAIERVRSAALRSQSNLAFWDAVTVAIPTPYGPEVEAELNEISRGILASRNVVDAASAASLANEVLPTIKPTIFPAKGFPRAQGMRILAKALGVVPPECTGIDLETLDVVLPTTIAAVLGRGILADEDQHAFAGNAALCAAAAVLEARGRSGGTEIALRQAVFRAAAWTLATHQIKAEVTKVLIDRYATMFDGSTRNWADSTQLAIAEGEMAVQVILANRNQTVDVASLGSYASDVAMAGILVTEQKMAVMAVGDFVRKSIDRRAGTAAPGLVRAVEAWSDKQIIEQVIPPLGIERLSAIAANISRDVDAILAGRKRIPQMRVLPDSKTGAKPQVLGPMFVTVPSAVEGNASTTVRKVTIPAGSYGEARVYSGVVCELGQTTPREMLLNLDYSWRGPNRSTLRMRDLRLIATATAMRGPARVYARIETMSYVFPSGRAWAQPVKGWCVDNHSGMNGIIGEWDLNLSQVLPISGFSGLISAVAGLTQPDTSVVINNATTSTLETDAGSPAQQGINKGAQNMADTMTKFSDRILANIDPAIAVPNGQPITCVLTESVVVEIPADEYNDVVETVTPSIPAGFSHAELN
jgi:hypothetical protein